jgi:hypothetical protein
MKTQTKGDWAELRVASAIRRLDYTVLVPFTESEQYDLGVDTGDRFIRVQVKYASSDDDGRVKVSCLGTNSSKTGNNTTFYTEDQIDGIAAFCGDLGQCFWIPFDEMNRYSLTLSEDGKHQFEEHTIENL